MASLPRPSSLTTVTEEAEDDHTPIVPSSSRSSPEERVNKKQSLEYLTVKKSSKLDKYDKRKEIVRNSPPKILVISKWLSTVFIGAALMICVSLCKTTIIELTHVFHEEFTATENDTKEKAIKTFVTLLLIVLIPYVFTLTRSAWSIFGRRDLPWPKRSAIFWCILSSLLECFGVCCFVLVTLQTKFASISLLLMESVLLLPILTITQQCLTSRSGNSSLTTAVLVASSVLVLIGVAGTAYIMYEHHLHEEWGHIILSVVGVVGVSFSWSPLLMKKTMVVKNNSIPKPDGNIENGNSLDSVMNISTSTYGSSGYMTSTENSRSFRNDTGSSGTQPSGTFHEISTESANELTTSEGSQSELQYTENNSHWKTLVISSSIKSIFVIPFFFLINVIVPMVDAGKFPDGWSWDFDSRAKLFVVNITVSVVGYFLAVFSCRTCTDKLGFILPLILVPVLLTPMQMFQASCEFGLQLNFDDLPTENFCEVPEQNMYIFVGLSAVAFFIARISLGYLAWKRPSIILEKETKIFYFSTFSSLLPDQWMMVNRRTLDMTGKAKTSSDTKTKIFICTTMFRENRTEMSQLLRSLWAVNIAPKKSDAERDFESHIFLDGAVRGGEMQENALQLVSLLQECLGINHLDDCTKTVTPYGLRLSWKLSTPNDAGKRKGMTFTIHMKDTKKVKNKKRWSQIMYMSYVLDFHQRQNLDRKGNILDKDEDLFILTTDADVKFKAPDVEALMDLMMRDPTVGAVCARTHPLGGGPLVWYQKFEYAIGHWFQKAAEHVLGSVLCAPGCFSIYRCSALRDIVPKYASDVEKAFDFLIKDMGEDRWLCTLMVQSGWRIEYCATSTNETYCPEEFDEFYKQRRRWVASTLANIWKLINEWKYVRGMNHRVSFLFCVYQIFLFVSTILAPSTVVMVVSGGLAFAWGVDLVLTVLLQIAVCIFYSVVCIKMNQKHQMMIGKILTFAYALVMTAVAVGIAKQVVMDFSTETVPEPPVNSSESRTTTLNPQAINEDIPYSVTTLYLGGLVCIFIITGILHIKEVLLLGYGLTYLLCLPSCYLVLMIYCICNITDRSWGTREEKADEDPKSGTTKAWHEQVGYVMRNIFCCCWSPHQDDRGMQQQRMMRSDSLASVSAHEGTKRQNSKQANLHGISPVPEESKKQEEEEMLQDESETPALKRRSSFEKEEDEVVEIFDNSDDAEVLSVDEWLNDEEMRMKYSEKFKANGYENTVFISTLTDRVLRKVIGVDNLPHRNHFLERIERLPQYKIEIDVPENVGTWLTSIGLEMYKKNFRDIKIVSPKHLETLKSMKEEELKKDLKITKHGHLKRLMSAIEKMRYPTTEERRIIRIKENLRNAYTHELSKVNKEEFKFWQDLIKACLKPDSNAFGQVAQLKVALEKLRFNALMVAGIVNCLWLVLAITLAGSADLATAGSNPLGLAFLVVFGLIFILQFLCMLVHRLETLSHFVARLPYKYGGTYKKAWSFDDDIDPELRQALREVLQAERESRKRSRIKQNQKKARNTVKRNHFAESETTPLIPDTRTAS